MTDGVPSTAAKPSGKTVVLGVTGSIAAYKAAEIASQLCKSGHDVFVVMTRRATEFITPLTLATLSRNPVLCDLAEENEGAWKPDTSSWRIVRTYCSSPPLARTRSRD